MANNYRVAYTVHSDINEEPVGSGSIDVTAASAKEARRLAVPKVLDTDPRCDERIHPQVRVTGCERDNATPENVAAVLPLLRKAARAKVEYHLACRAIERDVIGYDVDGLDDAIEGLSFNCDSPDQTDQITEKQAFDVLKHVRREK